MIYNQIDNFIIIVYFLATLWFGFYKHSKKDINSYLFAGRKLTIPALVATLVSTWYGGILEIGRFTYENGIVTWIIFGFFYYIAALLFVKFIAPKISSSNIPTIPELIQQSFGKWPAIISIICIISMTAPAPYLKILADLFNHLWNLDETTALCLGASMSLIYAFSGGFSAIVRTDKLQFVLMFTGFFIILFTCYYQYGGISFLINNTPNYAFSIPGHFNWTFIFAWGFIALITFIDPGFYQRSFAGNSLETVQKGIMISILFWILFDFLTVFTGLYALAILPISHSSPYLDLAELILPPFFKGLFIVSLFAIIMSTIDSFSFISALTIGKDLSKQLNLKQDDNNILFYTHCGLIITAISSIFLAMFFKNAIDIWYIAGSFSVPILLIPIISGLYKIKLKHILMVMILPFSVSLLWYIHGMINLLPDGYPGYIFGLDPLYPGIISSGILFLICKD